MKKKKVHYFIFSLGLALSVSLYNKYKENKFLADTQPPEWNTFIKVSEKQITKHPTTAEEYKIAKITPPDPKLSRNLLKRDIASTSPSILQRENRILLGEVDPKYEDEATTLEMINSPKPNWKELMGAELMRFQSEGTKVMVKEEFSIIKITDNKGRYIEQVIISYIVPNGKRNSFKAFVDSETGAVLDTWDNTIHEPIFAKKQDGFLLPQNNESGIIAR